MEILTDWNGDAQLLMPFKARIVSVEYRLRRSLDEVAQSPPQTRTTVSGQNSPEEVKAWIRVRQLGTLMSTATALLADIAAATSTTTSAIPAAVREPSASDWANEELSTEAATFYAEQLVERYAAVLKHVQQARAQLAHHKSQDPRFVFPLSCIGSRACRLVSSDGSGRAGVLVDSHDFRPTPQVIPAAQIDIIQCGAVDAAQSSPGVATASTYSALASHAPAVTAEDAVVDDIKRAVQQMKEGAMHMGEIMRSEEDALKASETLMVGGLQKVQQGSRDVDKLTGGLTRRRTPSLLRGVPGGAMVWQHVVLPLWDVAKQALLLALVIAVSGSVLMLMFVASKPQRLRLKS